MKKKLLNILKIVIPLGLGIFLLWHQYDRLSVEQKAELTIAFTDINIFWVLVSVLCYTASHISRAYRWRYMLNPMGYQPKFSNAFFSVMAGYFFNLLVPRMGELSRCAALAKYEETKFEEALGTVVAERVVDTVILASIIGAVFLLQLDQLLTVVSSIPSGAEVDDSTAVNKYMLLALVAILGLIFLVIINKSKSKFALKIQSILRGLFNGLKSIMKIRKFYAFLAHTAFIWSMYIATVYVCLFAVNGASNVSFIGGITTFAAASITVLITPGGIGFYQQAVQTCLALYGVSLVAGLAAGWVMWLTQTLTVVLLGVSALIIMPLINKK